MFTILHVEDDPAYNFLISEYFRIYFENTLVLRGANKQMTEHHLKGDFDLIICDGQIGGWDNHLEEVYEARKQRPFIILTGADQHVVENFKIKGLPIFQKSPQGQASMLDYVKEIYVAKYGQ